MVMIAPEWHEPRSLDEVLSLRAEHGEEATVVAGGSFLGIVINQKLFAPTMLVALRSVPDLDYIEADGALLRLGAMTTHRAVEDRKSTRLNSSHANISYAVFCLKKKKQN